jgi:N-acetylmuramoyl-L-alanine amidase
MHRKHFRSKGGVTKTALTIGMLIGITLLDALGLQITDHYSPLNRVRAIRKRTDMILLHTTEGPLTGSLNKLTRYGETHYLVGTDGHVYRVVNKRRIAMHAGRSMWNGRTNLDESAVAIEVVGYHNRDLTAAQYTALKELISDLQNIFSVPDERVLTHSMVAYGSPNRWHKHSHRGRKRCGMLFAKRSVRARLGLDRQPLFDPDVKAKRLVNADPYLAKVLYGSAREQLQASTRFEGNDALVISSQRSAWDIARDKYKSAETLYVFPDGKQSRGNEIKNWKAMPAGTRVVLSDMQSANEAEGMLVIGEDGTSAEDLAGDEVRAASTIYLMKDGRVRQGSELSVATVSALPVGTRLLVGYVHGGYVSAKRSAYDICGEKWNTESTLYRFRDGRVVAGNDLSEGAIPPLTMVFFQH